MAKYLFLLSISPVQSFISQARKLLDLAGGSRLLSDLANCGIECLKSNVCKVTIPKKNDDTNNQAINICLKKDKSINLDDIKDYKLELYFPESTKENEQKNLIVELKHKKNSSIDMSPEGYIRISTTSITKCSDDSLEAYLDWDQCLVEKIKNKECKLVYRELSKSENGENNITEKIKSYKSIIRIFDTFSETNDSKKKDVTCSHFESTIIFPCEKVESKPNRFLAEIKCDNDIESKPNRFLAEIVCDNDEDMKSIGRAVETAIKDKFKEIITKCICNGDDIKKNNYKAEEDKIFNEQVEDFLDIYWVAESLKNESYKGAYDDVEKNLASIKNFRKFKQIPEPGIRGTRKCSICGERDGHIKIDNFGEVENICGICYAKRAYEKKYNEDRRKENQEVVFESTAHVCLRHRLYKEDLHGEQYKFFQELYKSKLHADMLRDDFSIKSLENNLKETLKNNEAKNCESELNLLDIIDNLKKTDKIKDTNETISKIKKYPRYYCILMFDGDHMGEFLSGTKCDKDVDLKKYHKEMSECLGKFAAKAREVVKEHDGMTVYAGGDDFLAFLNIDTVFEVIMYLRFYFKTMISDKLHKYYNANKEMTFSAGLIIAHYATPLAYALQQARAAEAYSKDDCGRKALTVGVLKRSGEMLKASINFGNFVDSVDEKDLKIPEIDANIKLIRNIVLLLRDNDSLSTTFVKQIQQEFMINNNKIITVENDNDLLLIEMKRIIRHSCQKSNEREILIIDIETMHNKIKNMSNNIVNFINWLNIIDFFERKIRI